MICARISYTDIRYIIGSLKVLQAEAETEMIRCSNETAEPQQGLRHSAQ